MTASVSMPNPLATHSGPGTTASGQPQVVGTKQQAADLAAWLQSTNRTVSVLVVSSRVGHPDVLGFAAEHAGGVECYLLEEVSVARELSDHLPDRAAVFGEAVRWYGPGPEALAGLSWAPLVTYSDLAEVPTIAARLAREWARRSAPTSDARSAADDSLVLSPDGAVHQVGSDPDAARLAAHLLDPARRWPVVVVSVHPDATGPYLDPDQLAGGLKEVAAVVLITADASFGLTRALGDKRLSVFYGAGRVYPPGTAWTADMYQAPLHMCLSPNRGRRVTEDVAADALGAALAAGLLTRPAERPDDEHVSVKVRGPMGPGHAQVRTDDGRDAVMITARLGSDLPAQRLVVRGQRLTGLLRDMAGVWPAFLPDVTSDEPVDRARAVFPDGSRTLAKVQATSGSEATLLLHPDVPVVVDTGEDDASFLLSAGDVVAVEVVWEDGKAYGALLADPADGALVPAMGVLPGGPAWLTADDALAAPRPVGEPVQPDLPAPDAPAAVAVGELDVDEARRQLRTARDANELLSLELAEAEAQRDRLREDVRTLKDKLRQATSKRRRSSVDQVWRDPERQLRHEIEQAYLIRIPEEERAARPLPDRYLVGPDFLRSLADLQGVSRDKVLAVLVECLVGLDKELAGRQRHPWLVARAGRQEVRDDAAEAWRVSLQANTPGARRLKYWVLRDGTVEFDSVGHHDTGLH